MNPYNKIISLRKSSLALFVVLVAVIWTMFNIKKWNNAEKGKGIIVWDVTSYYGYLPALFIHNDLTLSFTDNDPLYYHHRQQFWPETAPNGGKVIKTTMGMAFMYAPFFFLGHLSAHLLGYETNGFSVPYEFFIALSCVFYLFIGLFFLRKILLKYFTDVIVSITLIIIVFGTNLFYYATVEPGMSHIYSFSLISTFIYHSILWHENQTIKRAFCIGLIGGLLVLIRPVNILIFIVPFFYAVVDKHTLIAKIKLFIKKRTHILLIGCTGLLIIFPQLLYWKYVTGGWFFNSYVGEQFYFNNPHIIEGLFSYRKGWLVYTPVMLFSLWGIYFLYKKNKELFFPIFLFTLVNIYVLYSWWSWWYGGGFGSRPMIDSYGLLAISIAGFLTEISFRKIIGNIMLSMILFLICLNLVQTFQKKRGYIHWDGMTKDAYWFVFLKFRLEEKDHERLSLLVSPPDYEKAKKGIDEYDFKLL